MLGTSYEMRSYDLADVTLYARILASKIAKVRVRVPGKCLNSFRIHCLVLPFICDSYE